MSTSQSVAPSGSSCACQADCCNALSTSLLAKVQNTSPPSSQLHGRCSRPPRNLPSGRTASACCVVSHSIAAQTIHATPCRRQTCFLTGTIVQLHTFTATKRSNGCLLLPAAFRLSLV